MEIQYGLCVHIVGESGEGKGAMDFHVQEA
jgi:ABC-type dipeptide/oligopeptide/nickel transport system ATPase subunit